mmetsp:Transcript_616/g.1272  ORF Transcript_616/g.1272 Transcript_616/m.1272 type:complete len:94 (-) Transcript_616:57-338(-)
MSNSILWSKNQNLVDCSFRQSAGFAIRPSDNGFTHKRRPVHERKSLALLGVQSSGRPGQWGRGKGGSRSGKEGKSGNLHHGQRLELKKLIVTI